MANETLTKIKFHIIIAIAILNYPLILLAAVLTKIFKKLFYSQVINDIQDDVALVTGAAHGLGKALAIELASKGCHLAIVDINIEGAENTAKLIRDNFQVKAKAYNVNVANYDEIVQLNEEVTKDLGTVNILINNAGILTLPNPLNPKWQDVQRMINVNMTSHFWTNGVFLPKMKDQRKGYIVAISSAASFISIPYNAVYTSSKYGVSGHMNALRQELVIEKQHNIHAMTVMPTFLTSNDEVVKLVRDVEMDSLYPLFSTERAAKYIVRGMLQHERELVIPAVFSLLHRILVNLPASWQTNILVLAGYRQAIKMYKLHS